MLRTYKYILYLIFFEFLSETKIIESNNLFFKLLDLSRFYYKKYYKSKIQSELVKHARYR